MRARCELCDCNLGDGWCKACSDWLARANSNAERQKRRYGRKKAGLVLVQAWVPAQAVEDVRAAIERTVADAEREASDPKTEGTP